MNVFECNKNCVYKKTICDNEGNLYDCGCHILQKPIYNRYPEFDPHTGEIIFQISKVTTKTGKYIPEINPKLGSKLLLESITTNNTGMSFDFRNFPADIHPGYHINRDYNLPMSIVATENSRLEAFGHDNITLVSTGWIDEKIFGINNKEECTSLLYGKFDHKLNININIAMRNYVNFIEGWKNYTTVKQINRTPLLYLETASDDVILTFCKERFPDKESALRMFVIMKEVQNGNYIDLRLASMNNGLSVKEANNLLKDVSTKTRKYLYRYFNVQKLLELYNFVSRFKEPFSKMYRSNIVNYLLNSDISQVPLLNVRYASNQRYWFMYLLLKRAYREKIIDDIPEHIHKYIVESKNKKTYFKLFDELYTLEECNNEIILDIYYDAAALSVEPQRLFPACKRLQDILDDSYNKSSKKKKSIFNKIVLAGHKWNFGELRALWKKFNNSYNRKRPDLFWNYIFEISHSSIDDSIDKMNEEPTEQKESINNILDLRTMFISNDTFDIDLRDPIELKARPKPKFKRKPKYFWIQLAKIGGLSKDDYLKEVTLSNDEIEQLIEYEQHKDEIEEYLSSPSEEVIIDYSEISNYSEYDIKNNQITEIIDNDSEKIIEEGFYDDYESEHYFS